jgi:RND family efflux transporter MFP subunit
MLNHRATPITAATLSALILLTAFGCSPASGDADGGGPAFRTGEADRGDITVTIEETGVVEPERQIVVKSPISGVASRLHVEAGDAVRAGQLLVTVVPDIAQANALAQLQSEISAGEISVANLQREFSRARDLAEQSLVAASEVEGKEAALAQAENQLAAARERLRLMEASGLQAAGNAQSARVTAPSAGVVILKGVEEGETVVGGTSAFGGGTELFTIGDLSTLLINAAINEVDIGKVAAGDTVVITVDAFPDDTAAGVVRLVPPAARQQDRVRVFDVEIVVTAGVEILRPGMTANVQIAGPTVRDVVRIPVEAVFFHEGRPTVFTVVDDQPVRTDVTLGLSNLTYVEVREGLEAGDAVALEDPADAERRAAAGR